MTLCVGFAHGSARHHATGPVPIRAVPYDRSEHELRSHRGHSPIFIRPQFWNFLRYQFGRYHFTVNAGLASMRVKLGEAITSGATLGTVGDTGLYFEIRRSGDTVDPAPWFGL